MSCLRLFPLLQLEPYSMVTNNSIFEPLRTSCQMYHRRRCSVILWYDRNVTGAYYTHVSHLRTIYKEVNKAVSGSIGRCQHNSRRMYFQVCAQFLVVHLYLSLSVNANLFNINNSQIRGILFICQYKNCEKFCWWTKSFKYLWRRYW